MDIANVLDAMRRKWPVSARIFFGLSLALGLGALTLMSGYRSQIERLRPDLGPPQAVVVAAHALARGAVIAPPDLAIRTLPGDAVPSGALTTADAGSGRVLLAGMNAGEVLTRSRIAPEGAGALAALVPPGLLAVVVPSSLPPGSVRAGDTVDVLTTFGGAHPHTETSATGAQILSVLAPASGGSTDIGTPAGPQLVLLVDASTASSLAYATAFGHVAIAVDPPDVTRSQELGVSPSPPGG
ncbi:MAG: Flp pilus assembly protein CpaB [Actinomycetota bacterium]